MKLQAVLVVVVLIAMASVAVLNQEVAREEKTIQLPWGVLEMPIVAVLLMSTAAALVLLYVINWFVAGFSRRARQRIEERLRDREREIAGMKSRAFDEVAPKLDRMREDVASQLAAFRVFVDERLSTGQPASVQTRVQGSSWTPSPRPETVSAVGERT